MQRRGSRQTVATHLDSGQILEAILRRWMATQSMLNPWQPYPWRGRTAPEIAADLLTDVEFREVQLAGFFGSPDGQLISASVGRLLPYPASAEYQLLVEAVTHAAIAKQRDHQATAAVWTIAAAATVTVLGSALLPSLRRAS